MWGDNKSIDKIFNEKGQEDILNRTVEEVRHLLKCDRVMIYSASYLPKALVLSESVDAKYSSILGTTVKDPFLTEDHLELYSYGLSVIIDDIYTADVSKSDLEDLEKLGIKSLAIAPILLENKLVALLVAHQYSKLLPWHLEAVNFLTEKANTLSVALSNIANASESKDSNSKQTTKSHEKGNSLIMDREEKGNSSRSIQPTEQKTKIQEHRNRSLDDVIDQIANQQEQEDLLDTTVEEVRHLLQCDRVVIYSLNPDSYGVVIAESVVGGWTRALDRKIDDPCFAFRYLEKYRQGRVRAWDNIYVEDATPCYLEQLEALEVKAKIVAPIINEDQLFGLLITHHCGETRNWQEQEIHWVTEIATQVGIMLEYSKMVAETDRQIAKPLAETQSKWNQNFTDAIQQIRQSLKQEDILKASVKEVRRVLECDRVLIYSLNQDNYGAIVAESVTAGWTKAEGRVIKDPCFEAKYLDKYRDGRVRVWSDIYESGMTNCHIEQLEQLEVKANLVVPIINEGKLFGLLAAQQCSDTRQWQQTEVHWLTQIATQVGFAIENAQLLADAQRLRQQVKEESKWTEYFTEAIQQIRQSLKTKDILKSSVREVRRILNCDRVLVYSLNQDNYGTIVAESVAHGWTRAEGRIIKDPCFEAKYLDKYRDGRVRVWSNIYEAGMSNCHIEQLEQLEVKANLVIPIIKEEQLFGLLVAQQCSDPREWQQPEVHWLTKIATQVGYALDNAKLLEQLEQSTKGTQEILDRAVNNSSNIQRIVQNVALVFNNLSQSCQKLSETINTLKDLSKQIAQQSMSITRAVNRSQIEEENQNLIFDLSDTIFSLMQELFEATAKIDPLFANIKTEVKDKTIALESETQQLIGEVEEFRAARQKLDQIVALNHEMSNLIEIISQSVENQIQSSTFAKDSVQEVTSIAERISQQSATITQSFNQLATLVQKF